jgi:hypothetical protein
MAVTLNINYHTLKFNKIKIQVTYSKNIFNFSLLLITLNMNTPKTNWTNNEFKAYLLLYAANADHIELPIEKDKNTWTCKSTTIEFTLN